MRYSRASIQSQQARLPYRWAWTKAEHRRFPKNCRFCRCAVLSFFRAPSLKLLDDTLPRTKVIGLLTQRDETKEDPTPQDLYSIGTAALVLKLVRHSEDNVLVIVQGLRRFSLRKIISTSPFLRAEVDLPNSVSPPESKEWEATFRNLRDSAARLFELTPDAPDQARLMILNIEDPEQLADFLAPN